jgi:hypothetical protein
MTTVRGSPFEGFLTRELDDGRNIVDDYLKRRGWMEGRIGASLHGRAANLSDEPL